MNPGRVNMWSFSRCSAWRREITVSIPSHVIPTMTLCRLREHIVSLVCKWIVLTSNLLFSENTKLDPTRIKTSRSISCLRNILYLLTNIQRCGLAWLISSCRSVPCLCVSLFKLTLQLLPPDTTSYHRGRQWVAAAWRNRGSTAVCLGAPHLAAALRSFWQWVNWIIGGCEVSI